jgi:hypothetical protein
MNKKINSLQDIDREMEALHSRKIEMEQKMEYNWSHFQQQFPQLLRNTLFKRTGDNVKNSWASILFSIPKVQETISNTTEKLAVKVEEILMHWFDKLFQKKHE